MSGRFAVLIAVLGACASTSSQDQEDTAQPIAGSRLRIMAGNLTSGSGTYNDGPGMRIFAGLHPDVALVQEMKFGSNSAADLRQFLDTAFGTDYQMVRGSSGSIPNAVVSRFPILESGDITDPLVSDRAFTYARIDIPGPKDLWAFSVHLLTSSASKRQSEANVLAAEIAQRVPGDDYVVIGGDFNTHSRSEGALSALASVVVSSGSPPVDQSGDGDTNASRQRPYDWVLVDDVLNSHATTTVIGANAFSHGLVVDTKTYQPIGDLAPARTGDSHASGMQHMGVVRDFDVPTGGGGGPDAGMPPDGGGMPPDGGGGGTADVHLDEILANEPGSDPGGEFVELLNRGGATADLAGWTISDAVGIRHVFPPGTTLAPGARIAVFGLATAIPAGTPNATAASSHALGLSNGGDTVTIGNATGAVVDALTYPSALAGVDGVSMNTSNTPRAGFVLHTTLSSRPSSPGTAP